MATISTKTHFVKEGNVTVEVQVKIEYNSTFLFFAKLPTKYNAQLNSLAPEAHKELGIEPWYKTRADKYNNRVSGFFVRADKEADITDLFIAAMRKVININVGKREVILVWFKQRSGEYSNSRKFNKEHGLTGLEIGLKYATEISFGDARSYQTTRTWDMPFSGQQISHDKYDYPTIDACIIDDTPENRGKLERIH